MNESTRGAAAAVANPYRSAAPSPPVDDRELGPRYAAIRAHIRCNECLRSVPVNGPELQAECPYCGTGLSIATGDFQSVVDTFECDHASLARRQVAQRTEAGLQIDALWHTATPEPAGWNIECAPAWLRRLAPTAARVWTVPAVVSESEAVVLACPRCQGGIEVDAQTARVIRCPACEGRVFLPEALWAELHGPSVARAWIIEFRGENRFDERRRLDARRDAWAKARDEAERKRNEERARRNAAAEAAAMSRDMNRLGRWARRCRAALLAAVVFAIASPWLGMVTTISGTTAVALGAAGWVLLMSAAVIALDAGGRLITRATGHRDLMFGLWFNFVFVIVMPFFGHLLAFEAAWGLARGEYKKRWGASTRMAAQTWLIIGVGGLLHIASMIVACCS
ncbi:MAG: hypothetical protein AAF721_04935 [Myxococcota bacterium]